MSSGWQSNSFQVFWLSVLPPPPPPLCSRLILWFHFLPSTAPCWSRSLVITCHSMLVPGTQPGLMAAQGGGQTSPCWLQLYEPDQQGKIVCRTLSTVLGSGTFTGITLLNSTEWRCLWCSGHPHHHTHRGQRSWLVLNFYSKTSYCDKKRFPVFLQHILKDLNNVPLQQYINNKAEVK